MGCFVFEWLEWVEANARSNLETIAGVAHNWQSLIYESIGLKSSEILNFVDWDIKHTHDFYRLCLSPALNHPFNPTQRGTFERWLIANIWEFIFFSMPELVSDIEAKLPNARQYIIKVALYMNILLPPPGYPLPYGRKIVDGVVQWGSIRWWY